MKITEVKIIGFKSFVETVALPIEHGLTGIVGPNGCGKSNILEAMRWVMGATSAKALRGADMDDVIFAGNDNRPARDIAEVIIKIDNADGKAPDPFRASPILEISRKIKRGAGSSFRINGKEVRAKDVQLIFADASSGANSPALVRQGQISELINARPENRRKVLEEAAGISGLQARRHEAQNKLNGAQANLTRIGEIIIIMEENIAALKKQATRANKYKNLQAQIRGLEIYLAKAKLQNLEQMANQANSELQTANNDAGILTRQINQAQSNLEKAEAALAPLYEEQAIAEVLLRKIESQKSDIERDFNEINEKITSTKQNINRVSKDIGREEEIIKDAQTALKEAQNTLDSVKNIENNIEAINNFRATEMQINSDIAKIEASLNQKIAQQSQLRANIEAFEREIRNIESASNANQRDIDLKLAQIKEANKKLENDNRVKTAETELALVQENLKTILEEIEDFRTQFGAQEIEENELRQNNNRLENQIGSIKAELNGLLALTKNNKHKIQDIALDKIKVEAGFERAVSAAFSDRLNAKIGKSDENHWLKTNQEIIWPQDLVNKIDMLYNHVNAPNELHALLKASGIVSEDDFANINQLPQGFCIITLTGKFKNWDGYVNLGKNKTNDATRLEHLSRIEKLETQIAPLIEEQKDLEANFAKIRSQNASLRAKINNKNNELTNLQKAIGIKQNALNQAQSAQMQAKNQISLLQEQLENLENRKASLKERAAAQKAKAPDFSPEANNIIKQEIEASRLEITKLRTKLSNIIAKKMELEIAEKNRISTQENAQKIIKQWQERDKNSNLRIKELKEELKALENQLETLIQRPQIIERNRQAILNEFPILEARKRKANDNLALAQGTLREAQLALKSSENEFNKAKEAYNKAQFQVQNFQERMDELKIDIWQNYKLKADELDTNINFELGDIVKNLNPEKAQIRLQKAFEERNNIGGVNLRADIELKEQEEKHQILASERADLLAALKKLHKAIDEINSEGKERLLAAFEKVNRHFIDLFTTLFGGGTAHLALSESDDPLGGGLEVYACPPGKKLSSMSLMSGGEQALTASALIFAVFLSNPAPISVLDELDAPLDDANVDRFCTLLDEMRKRTETRFICITHHPITMARMDRLFGVTMAERGVSNVVSVDLSRAQSMIEAV